MAADNISSNLMKLQQKNIESNINLSSPEAQQEYLNSAIQIFFQSRTNYQLDEEDFEQDFLFKFQVDFQNKIVQIFTFQPVEDLDKEENEKSSSNPHSVTLSDEEENIKQPEQSKIFKCEKEKNEFELKKNEQLEKFETIQKQIKKQ